MMFHVQQLENGMVIAEHIALAFFSLLSLLLLWRHWRAPSLFRQTQQLIAATDSIREELETERRKCAEFLKKITDVLKERDFWRDWYQTQASQHAHAQSYLLLSLEQVAVEYHKATGKPAPIDAGAANLVRHFSTEHAAAIEAVDRVAKGSAPQPLQADRVEQK